ncbi:DUF4350 domain-containing protein [Micromonospora echinofusca]|uniref:DUF4350 domain-containing protein n=1 Tax=Micromonospora echinofusca TaxID=47858 RepID=A0ABS3VM83_MICEH|nr:DUF4350 domain-containing protein [Micromonospora echinofusca]MBO4205644.1 DUF4350 domain-containing protein [Micromonospora echinofusca]
MTPRRTLRWRRWHRAAVPFLLLVLFYLVTGVTHAVQEPDLDEPGTLSPVGTGPDGSRLLADRLAAAGVTVRVVTSSAAARTALGELAGKPATVFVPAPDYPEPRFLDRVAGQYPGNRVVLVRPGGDTAFDAGFLSGPSRWAARTVAPGCGAQLAVDAGRAAVLRSRYAADPETSTTPVLDCYDGGLVAHTLRGTEFVLVGATDPFRNSRIDEAGNSALAVGLLSRDRQVIWVDLHRPEPRPSMPPPPAPEYRQPDRTAGGSNPMWSAFPPALWAGLVLLGVLAVLVVVVRGRRLGPPVAEPLPVAVPATELVVGWGRLYQRGRARAVTLDALRAAAVRRITHRLDPTGVLPDDSALAAAVAARLGVPVEQVRAVLHPDPPTDDDELISAVAGLDALAAAVERTAPRPDGSVDPGGTP